MNTEAAGDPEKIMDRYLVRDQGIAELTANVKLKVATKAGSASAKGKLIYLQGERYELKFNRPYSDYLGDFYVTPERVIYWDTHMAPQVFDSDESVFINLWIPGTDIRWSPRDVLPFPISVDAHQSGELTRSNSEPESMLAMEFLESSHKMKFDGKRGILTEEMVCRTGCDTLVKSYSKTRTYHGIPVATKVECGMIQGEPSITWILSKVNLKPADSQNPLPEQTEE